MSDKAVSFETGHSAKIALLTRLAMAALAVCCGCASSARPQRSVDELVQARRVDDATRAADAAELMKQLVARGRAERDAHASRGGITSAADAPAGPTTRPTLDLLVISGGGDWGAFGAGVLKGWGRVAGDMARPEFDVVTGVSTGALIAPFAFLGDEQSIDRVVRLYRNPRKDWAKPRGMLYFWPTNPSFFALPGLEREVEQNLDRATLERIAAQDGTGRALLVNTTNVDYGDMHAWDMVAETKAALARGDEKRVQRILLASAGIPGVFPARGIDDCLYVDGAITGNILYGGRVRDEEGFHALWHAQYPDHPSPRVRYWVIFNNQMRFAPQVTPRKWPDIISRATLMATQTATVNSMRHLFARAEVARLKRNADIEVRVIAVPDDWTPPNLRVFDREVMNALADLGERMGADPASWRTESP